MPADVAGYQSPVVIMNCYTASSSRQASSPASEVMVAPRNSNRIRRSKRSVARGLVLSPIGCLQCVYVIKNPGDAIPSPRLGRWVDRGFLAGLLESPSDGGPGVHGGYGGDLSDAVPLLFKFVVEGGILRFG